MQKVAPNGDELLYAAYAASMRVAHEQRCGSVCFSLLSAGFFRGNKPLHDVLAIACRVRGNRSSRVCVSSSENGLLGGKARD